MEGGEITSNWVISCLMQFHNDNMLDLDAQRRQFKPPPHQLYVHVFELLSPP